jgi:hypothetical protein
MTVTWTLNANQALQRAYLMIGALTSPDYTMSDFQAAQGLTVANALLKSMQTWGASVFRQFPQSLTVLAASPTVAIPNDVVGIEEARWVVSLTPLYERALGRFQWVDYMNLPTKNAQGAPTLFMFDYQVNSTQLYIWPVPTIPGQINCTVVRRANDMNALTDPIDLPSEWIEGFTYLLADALIDDQGLADENPGNVQHVRERAVYWSDKVQNFDRPTSVFLRPWGRKGTKPFWR